MTKQKRAIKTLGEIALRVNNLSVMQEFYQEVVGLELLKRFPDSVFFEIAEGYAGHTQILALFDRSKDPNYKGLNPEKTTVDHIAFAIDSAEYEPEIRRLEQLGMQVRTAEHAWVHWRSLYLDDPEGNTIEWVCYDGAII